MPLLQPERFVALGIDPPKARQTADDSTNPHDISRLGGCHGVSGCAAVRAAGHREDPDRTCGGKSHGSYTQCAVWQSSFASVVTSLFCSLPSAGSTVTSQVACDLVRAVHVILDTLSTLHNYRCCIIVCK